MKELRDEQAKADDEKKVKPTKFVTEEVERKLNAGLNLSGKDFVESDIKLFGRRETKTNTMEDERQKENSSNNAQDLGRSTCQGNQASKRRKMAISEIEYVLETKTEEAILLYICCQLLPCVVHPTKVNVIKNTVFKDLPDLFEWATVSDIAFAILIFDNYFVKWWSLEQYSFDTGKEMLEKHKRLLKGRIGGGNGLSGSDGLKRYQEILWRVVHMLSSAQKDWNNRFWKNFWERFRDERHDMELLEQKQSTKAAKTSNDDDLVQEKDVVEQLWTEMLHGELSGGMPPLTNVGENSDDNPFSGVTAYGC